MYAKVAPALDEIGVVRCPCEKRWKMCAHFFCRCSLRAHNRNLRCHTYISIKICYFMNPWIITCTQSDGDGDDDNAADAYSAKLAKRPNLFALEMILAAKTNRLIIHIKTNVRMSCEHATISCVCAWRQFVSANKIINSYFIYAIGTTICLTFFSRLSFSPSLPDFTGKFGFRLSCSGSDSEPSGIGKIVFRESRKKSHINKGLFILTHRSGCERDSKNKWQILLSCIWVHGDSAKEKNIRFWFDWLSRKI